MNDKPHTLVMVLKGQKILLGLKKRGFGAGWWNGFGGKLLPNESFEESAARELLEESGLRATRLVPRGELIFSFEGQAERILVRLFECSEFSGEPLETEEMRPEWFAFTGIPFGQMWPSDRLWLPAFLEGSQIRGLVHFDKDKNIASHNVLVSEPQF